jgi:hypothetical protein
VTVNKIIIIAGVTAGFAVTTLASIASAQSAPAAAQIRVAAAPVAPGERPTVAPPVAGSADVPGRLISRESYVYEGTGRRDPFVSLMNTEELRPLFGDLKLVAVAFDPLGRNSVAVLRDVTSKEQYRVKVGQAIGRMRVASIHEKSVTFGIEEFGYKRQETLAMNDSTKVRTQ